MHKTNLTLADFYVKIFKTLADFSFFKKNLWPFLILSELTVILVESVHYQE